MTDLERAQFLWELLDRIDTLDDACRKNDTAFRRFVREHVARRHEIFRSNDGMTLERTL